VCSVVEERSIQISQEKWVKENKKYQVQYCEYLNFFVLSKINDPPLSIFGLPAQSGEVACTTAMETPE
jgi:hypothetical protein